MKVNKLTTLTACLVMLALVTLSACSSTTPATTTNLPPIRIGVAQWIGFSLLYIARDKDFFAQEGVKVDIVSFDTYDAQSAAFASKSIDGGVLVLSDTVAQAAAHVPLQDVWLFDESNGGDVLVGNSSIQSPADLKGKRIAFSYGTFGQVFVLTGLAKYGISPSDVTIVNLSGENIPQALAAGKIDAGHTWDPFLGQAVKNGAHPIFTSADTPGIIVDTLELNTAIIQQRPDDVKAILRAFLDAATYWAKNPDAGNQIVAKAVGVTPGDIPSILTGDRLYSLADVQTAFDPKNQQSIYQSAKTISDFFIQAKVIQQAPDFQAMLNPTFVQALSQSK